MTPVTLRRRWRWWKKGRFYGYPVCCIVRFCVGGNYSGLKRGGCDNGPDRHPAIGQIGDRSVYVPCGVIHRHDPDKPPDLELLRWYEMNPVVRTLEKDS